MVQSLDLSAEDLELTCAPQVAHKTRSSSWSASHAPHLLACLMFKVSGLGIRVSRYKATWKREFKLPWRKAGLLISMI